MALFKRGRGRDPKDPGMSPFKAGLIAATVILVFSFFGFSRYNPFAHPYKLHATFESANNLQPKSPVRVAGIDVGKVTEVEPLKTRPGAESGAAKVTMEIEKKGLPIHKDAELKIRPRIFLEGNFFIDLQPGTPAAATVKDGGDIPVQQTATPVQFGQVLTALQADTRKNLQTFLKEYAEEGLGNGGAQAYNKGLDSAAGAFRYSAIANQASLGLAPHDLSKLLRGQQRLFKALSTHPEILQSLIHNLNVTAGAFAREDAALAASIPALRDLLRVGRPALISLNNTLPTLRAFARDALPGVRSSGPTLDASLPFIKQLRLAVRPQELQGLARDLRFAIPDLARLNRATIPLLNNQRALSACTNNVLVPFSKKPVPDPDFANKPGYDGGQNNQPFMKEAPRGLVGLSGESRTGDANSPMFHVQLGSGPQNVVYTNEGQTFVFQGALVPEGNRPAKPDHRPVFRPGTPCELQEVPDLHAPGGPADRTYLTDRTPVPIPDLPLPKNAKSTTGTGAKGEIDPNQDAVGPEQSGPGRREKGWSSLAKPQVIELMRSYLSRTARGIPTPDPMQYTYKDYVKLLKKFNLVLAPSGKLVERAAPR
ncbi:MAG TPA: MlaD family protein [Thermoleophilaceae bacterium]|nr:MlaD family protein [Thermoleophilaceae bacterium]